MIMPTPELPAVVYRLSFITKLTAGKDPILGKAF
jgi:hypothetical protein